MNPNPLTLQDILDAKERRAVKQKELLSAFHCPLVSCTANVAGIEKDSPRIRRAFSLFVSELLQALSGYEIRYKEIRFLPTGPEAFFAVAGDAVTVKRILIETESVHPAGRLLDADVFTEDGKQVSRTMLGFPERSCLVCGKPGRGCISGQAHPLEEVLAKTSELLNAWIPYALAGLAVRSLVEEVHVTPKPGLVDERNSGSHSDMDLPLMEKSAASLRSYFETSVRIGAGTASLDPGETFPLLRQAGLEAEQVMFRATGGVNTHKGAIYLFGILLGAIGRLIETDASVCWDPVRILDESARIASRSVKEDLERIRQKETGLTAGERIFKTYGLSGARGEASEGFPSVRKVLAPLLSGAVSGEAFLAPAHLPLVLLELIAEGRDTNLIARGGHEKAKRATETVRTLLSKSEIDRADLEALDRDFIADRLSPGGSADLLAVTIFLAKLQCL